MSRYELEGQVAIVTGGARGIGRAIATRLATEGADIAILDRDSASDAISAIRTLGRRGIGVRVDVTDRLAVDKAFAAVIEELGRLDVLVNNAGYLRAAKVLDIDDDDWERHMAVNAKGPLVCSQAAARQMIAQGVGGRIITIVSTAGRLPSGAPIGAYVASKHAAMGLVQQLGTELAPYGILVNAVFPGIVDTDMLTAVHQAKAARTGETYDAVRAADVATIPIGRFQTPDDVANIVAFLASSDANYSAGQAFDASGGAFFW